MDEQEEYMLELIIFAISLLLASHLLVLTVETSRLPSIVERRLDWESFVESMLNGRTFLNIFVCQ